MSECVSITRTAKFVPSGRGGSETGNKKDRAD